MENKKMTTPIISVGADTEQSLNVCNDSITDSAENFKDLEKSLREMQREMLRQMDRLILKRYLFLHYMIQILSQRKH